MNVMPYVYDFVSILFEDLDFAKSVERIVLFGSAARGEQGSESDIDIFVDVSRDKVDAVEAIVRESEKRFLAASGRKWKAMGMDLPISIVTGNLMSPDWEGLREEMAGGSIMLYGKPEFGPGGSGRYSLLSYSLSGVPQERKMGLIRRLFGYKTKKGEKEYVQKGIVDEIGGVRLVSGALMVPAGKADEVSEIFAAFGVSPKKKEVWMKD